MAVAQYQGLYSLQKAQEFCEVITKFFIIFLFVIIAITNDTTLLRRGGLLSWWLSFFYISIYVIALDLLLLYRFRLESLRLEKRFVMKSLRGISFLDHGPLKYTIVHYDSTCYSMYRMLCDVNSYDKM